MALLFWKQNPEIDAFALQLANHFSSRLPPSAAEAALAAADEPAPAAPRKRKTAQPADVLEKLLGEASQQLHRFSEQRGLGIYGRARMHMQFRSRLVDLGYAKDVARGVDSMILLRGA
jgi:hypothetical protein